MTTEMKMVYPMQLTGSHGPVEVASLEAFIEQCHRSPTGTYLLGSNRLWHGGIHLSEMGGWHPSGVVRAMADGEIVAYRLATEPLKATRCPEQGTPGQAVDLSTSPSFCLLRHRYQPGGKNSNDLTFYSLYMHIACESYYRDVTAGHATIKHPDVMTYQPVVQGSPSMVIPRVEWDETAQTDKPWYALQGAEVDILQPEPSYHLCAEKTVDAYYLVRYSTAPDSLFYIAANALQIMHPEKPCWMVSAEDKPARRQISDHTRLLQAPGSVEGDLALPAGSEVVIVGESKMVAAEGGMIAFCPVRVFKTGDGTVTDNQDQIIPNAKKGTYGWLLLRKLGQRLQAEPNLAIEFNKVVDRSQRPIAVKAGEIIAHWGAHETACAGANGLVINPDKKAVHVEVFVANQERETLARYIHNQAGDAELVSQHDWGKLGVAMLDGSSDPDGFLDKANTDGKECGDFFRSVYQQLLSAHDTEDMLSGDEIKSALADKSLAHKLRRLFIRHESEWIKRPEWKRLKAELRDQPNLYQYALDVTNNMAWIDDEAIKAILGDTKPWFIHPAGMMELVMQLPPDDEMDEKWLIVPKGQLTFDAEGNDVESSIYFSRVVHWPGNSESGVTIGRGYDLGNRTKNEVYCDLLDAGVPEHVALIISNGVGVKGLVASEFVACHKSTTLITRKAQYRLFQKIYPAYVRRAEANYEYWTTDNHINDTGIDDISVSDKTNWEDLDEKVKDVIVDLVYQGFTKGPRPMLYGMVNDKERYANYIKNNQSLNQYEPGRKRVKHLMGK